MTDRSPESVERLFDAIRAALRVHPDWRVGQVLVNAHSINRADLFYAENSDLAQAVSNMTARIAKEGK